MPGHDVLTVTVDAGARSAATAIRTWFAARGFAKVVFE
jgi:hypothetical protein